MENKQEIWKDIKGYEGKYQVSNLGRVKSLPRKKWCGKGYRYSKEKILKQKIDKGNYLYIILCKNSKPKTFKTHRLVAKYFISNPYNKPAINHIDCNKQNNKIENLEWVTSKENGEHAAKNNLTASGETHETKSKLTKEQVLDIRKKYKKGKYGYIRIAKEYGVSDETIRRIILRKRWTKI